MINYRGTPLFGEDSSVSHTSEFFAIVGTVLFWLLFLIFSFVIKVEPKKQYKEVQIVLSSTPVVEKTVESSAPAEQAAANSASSEPVVEKVVEPPAPASATKPVEQKVETPAPKKVETPKPKTTAPQKTQQTQKQPAPKPTPAPQTSEPEKYAQSVDDAIAKMNTTPSKTRVSDADFDSMFNDNDSEVSDYKEKKIVTTSSSASGTAGQSVETEEKKLTSTSVSNTNNTQAASSSTSSALKGIKDTPFHGLSVNGIHSETTARTRNSGSGRVEMEMSNGHSRALIDPKEPVINIPPELYSYIDSTRFVTISFKVLNSGNVTDVRITPESSLHSSIRQEIIGQLLFWRFEPADYAANATFEYKIIKK